MISREDCVAFSGLTEEEVEAIAEHEHMPVLSAAALGAYLLHRHHGVERIRDMIVDDIRAARAQGEAGHAAALLAALRQFLSDYPEARRPPPAPH